MPGGRQLSADHAHHLTPLRWRRDVAPRCCLMEVAGRRRRCARTASLRGAGSRQAAWRRVPTSSRAPPVEDLVRIGLGGRMSGIQATGATGMQVWFQLNLPRPQLK